VELSTDGEEPSDSVNKGQEQRSEALQRGRERRRKQCKEEEEESFGCSERFSSLL
jgi:hypothetical protein